MMARVGGDDNKWQYSTLGIVRIAFAEQATNRRKKGPHAMRTQLFVAVFAGAASAVSAASARRPVHPAAPDPGARARKRLHHPARRRPPDAPGGRQPVGPGRLDGGAGGAPRRHALPRARHPSGNHHRRHQRPGRRAAHPPGDPGHGAGTHRGEEPRAQSAPGAGRLLRRDRVGRSRPRCRPSGSGSTNSRTATTSTGTSGLPTTGTCSTAGTCATRIRCRPAPSRTTWR